MAITVDELQHEILANMARQPTLAFKGDVKVSRVFPVAPCTLGKHAAVSVGAKTFAVPLGDNVRVPADYAGADKVAIFTTQKEPQWGAVLRRRYGYVAPKLKLHWIVRGVSAGAEHAIAGACGDDLLDQLVGHDTEPAEHDEDEVPFPCEHADDGRLRAAADAVNRQPTPSVSSLLELARIYFARFSAKASLGDRWRRLSVTSESAFGRAAVVVDHRLFLLHDDEIPVQAFAHPEEGEWREFKPGVIAIVRNHDPLSAALRIALPDLEIVEFWPREARATWAEAFTVALGECAADAHLDDHFGDLRY